MADVVVPLPTKHRRRPTPPRRRQLPNVPKEPLELKSLEHWRFQWHEEILKRRDLSRSEIAVAGVLMHKYRPDRGYAEISLGALARGAGCSRDRVRVATRQLREAGLVIVINEGARNGRTFQTGKYRLVYLARGVGDVGQG
jgi:hypothetical protein